MSTETLPPPSVRWDLSALFDGMDDPRLASTWAELETRTQAFADRYKGRINHPDLTANDLAAALQEAEGISQTVTKPLSYANLLFAGDSSNAAIGAFLQKQSEQATALNVRLLFFDLEIQAIPAPQFAALVDDPALTNYRHYLETSRQYTPHRLSEAEEIIMEELANTGARAWVRLFEEITANHVFRLELPGEEARDATEQEVLTLLRDADRARRQAAGDSLTKGLKELERVLVFTYNNLLQNKSVEDRLRRFQYAEQSRHMANELDRETVDLVVRLCKEHHGLVSRYYHVKREILGLSELTHIDRYAPLFEAEAPVAWAEAQRIVLDSFGEFSPVMRDRAAEFFDAGWIDAEPRKGKAGGAFCAYVTPDTHPYVLQTYLNRMNDVMTLAHELGHGVHASLSRQQSYFNFHGTLPLAELASIFGEMLVFERLVRDANPKDRVALYAEKIEGIFASVFRQASMFRFEQRCHAARRETGELSPEEFGDIWQDELQSMFGDSVIMGEQHRMWWSYVGHFIFAPFYVYAYAFGELLTLSLYDLAKQQGPEFADRYLDVLRTGGAESPDQLMARVGVDLHSEVFWRGGFRAIDRFVTEFEQQWANLPK